MCIPISKSIPRPIQVDSEVPKDNPDFQGLLDNEEEEAIYPDISAFQE